MIPPKISYRDAAIIAAAKRLGCAAVNSDGLNPGRDYDGVWLNNPFTFQTPEPFALEQVRAGLKFHRRLAQIGHFYFDNCLM